MQSIGYYTFDDTENRRNGLNLCSVASSKLPLEVNCAGCFCTRSRFLTDNREGRLDYYLLYMTSGSLELMLPEGSVTMRAGSFVIIPPQTRYRYAHTDECEMDYLWVHFTGSQVLEILEEYGLSLYPAVYRIEEDGGVGRKLRNLFDAFARRDCFRARELSSLFDGLLIFLARRVANGGRDDRLLAASLRYIHSSYHTEIKVPELAKIERLSVSRYNTVFRKIMGMSPIEYVTKMRLSSACELLGNTDLSVKEIGLLVGYTDPHFFSRVFKSHMGVSPAVYRSAGKGMGGDRNEI
ncbi:MAG: helix-turn-helix transcriptional regulator [Clostridia bacterium]|nr:helix-turn-helix transcriptional regulator [Clostridia bacterium]